jgi:hypothetical protein
MNLALDYLADNPIIDELVFWPPKAQRMLRVRGCSAIFRKPFIEVTMAGGEVFQRHFPRQGFAEYWAEACVILQTLTRIEIVSDFDHEPVADRESLVARVLACRDECIAEAEQMFDQGMYAQFLQQFGEDCTGLTQRLQQRIAIARERLSA